MSGNRAFKNVAVLMGGPSSEREVSLRSGAAVARGLEQAGYCVQSVELTRAHVDVPAGVEAVFVALHGAYGEDGGVQADLNRLGIPYTGSGYAASRAAMDKAVSKKLFLEKGIPTASHELLRQGQRRTLSLPVVVKPTLEGSSIGVHRVLEEAQWTAALADALAHGSEVLVEAYIEGRELTVGVVGGEALPVVEIEAPGGWYGYDVKYTKGACRYHVPAALDAATAARCQRIALDVFSVLGCRGMGRVDFRLAADGTPCVLELNSIPGFTETSLLPKAAAAAGISFSGLCDRIMKMAQTD
jgi:D-alanine-D-alanine ligase